MNKTLSIGIVVLIVLAAGVGLYMSNSASKNDEVMMEAEKEKQAMMEKEAMEKDAMMKEEQMKKDGGAMMDKSGETMMKDESAMMKAGSYESYSAEKVAMASATHDVVLFFRASWCPTCRAVDADIRARLKNIPESLTILDVNYDTAAELKKKYGVTYQHTFVQVDAQGNQIKKWSASPTLAAIVSEVK